MVTRSGLEVVKKGIVYLLWASEILQNSFYADERFYRSCQRGSVVERKDT